MRPAVGSAAIELKGAVVSGWRAAVAISFCQRRFGRFETSMVSTARVAPTQHSCVPIFTRGLALQRLALVVVHLASRVSAGDTGSAPDQPPPPPEV